MNAVRLLLTQKKSLIMGIVNVTPDSFSDGGHHNSLETAFVHSLDLVDEGADILDIGGESTRPNADVVNLQQELDRVIPLIERLCKETSAPISIDTYKPAVMREAIAAGAHMINDVNGLQADDAIATAYETQVPVCIMHMQGQPKSMQLTPSYDNVVDDITFFFQERINACTQAGIHQRDIILDPGIGFGKSLKHNLLLLKNLNHMIQTTNCEFLVGVSRKSLIQQQLGRPVSERLAGSLGLAVQAVINGAKIIRVHDVRATYDAIRMVEAVIQEQ